ncbi:MAG: ATP-binding cassette domain-containing protein [Ignisphaera sp.]
MEIEQVVVEGLEKRYKYFTLKIPRLVFRKGVNLILGPNGSGKSTLLKSIAGFIRPDRGEIYTVTEKGEKISTVSIVKLMGYVGEDVVLPNMRVGDILADFLGDEKAREMSLELGLEGYLHKKYLELSAGYRKRVQLAIALGKDAKIVLLDEPFANLDILMIEPLEKILTQLRDRIVIVTSHQLYNLEPSTVTIIDQGQLIYHGGVGKASVEVVIDVSGEERMLSLEDLNKLIKPIRIKKFITLQEKLLEMIRKNVATPNANPSQQK